MKNFFGSLFGTIIGSFIGTVAGSFIGMIAFETYSEELLGKYSKRIEKRKMSKERNKSNVCDKSEEPKKVPMGFHTA